MTKEEIIHQLQLGFDEVAVTVKAIDPSLFFKKPDAKWSIAGNLEHLRLSVKPLNLVFRLPKFSLLLFGTPNRSIRAYDELVAKYHAKLNAGGRATSSFVPKYDHADKNVLIRNFINENEKLIKGLTKWTEADLDRYLIPHPLLGKLYAREMLYFTIYHTQHHLRAIEKLL